MRCPAWWYSLHLSTHKIGRSYNIQSHAHVPVCLCKPVAFHLGYCKVFGRSPFDVECLVEQQEQAWALPMACKAWQNPSSNLAGPTPTYLLGELLESRLEPAAAAPLTVPTDSAISHSATAALIGPTLPCFASVMLACYSYMSRSLQTRPCSWLFAAKAGCRKLVVTLSARHQRHNADSSIQAVHRSRWDVSAR